MAKVKSIKGEVWCYACNKAWKVANKHAYMQCPACRNYRVYAVGSLAYYHAMKERQGRQEADNKNNKQ